MSELKDKWEYDRRKDVRGRWWLVKTDPKASTPNRAYISPQTEDGLYELHVWERVDGDGARFIFHAASDDLKALKAVGRIAASQRLEV